MKNFRIQLLIAVALVLLPVVMIYYNGKKAVVGILSEPNSNEKEVAISTVQKEPAIKKIEFGVYDPSGTMRNSQVLQSEVYYISWINFNTDSLLWHMRRMKNSGRKPILIVEPWAKNQLSLFDEINNKTYDAELSKIASVFSIFKDTVLISWGHEMDQDLTKRYPWSGKEPRKFIEAYKYVHQFIDSASGNTKWIWAPVGKEGCTNYYPGETYVDEIGLPVYSFPEWEMSYYGFIKSFAENFGEKYSRIIHLNKPVTIIEFGVTGTFDFKQFWLRNAFGSFQKFPLLSRVVFFQSKDTEGVWGNGISTPEWILPQEVLDGFVKWHLGL